MFVWTREPLNLIQQEQVYHSPNETRLCCSTFVCIQSFFLIPLVVLELILNLKQ